MKHIYTAAALGLIYSASMLGSCRKNQDGNEDTGYATEQASLEKTFSDVQSIADEAASAGTNGSYLRTANPDAVQLGNCATITHDTVAVPHTLTVDFGSTNCLCADGIYRRGKIMLSYTGRYKDAGHEHRFSFGNYFVNDNGVSGTKTVTMTGIDPVGNPTYTIVVNGSIALANGNGTITMNSSRTRHYLSGYATGIWSDDSYEINGSGTITRANGSVLNVSITKPLIAAPGCRWIESGTVSITPRNGNSRTLDYGNGTCDALATLSVGNKTYNITLR
jgi:hypothetical protein